MTFIHHIAVLLDPVVLDVPFALTFNISVVVFGSNITVIFSSNVMTIPYSTFLAIIIF